MRRCSRIIAASSTSKSSSATIRSKTRVRARNHGVPHVDRIPLLAFVRQVEDLVDRLRRPMRRFANALGGDEHHRPAVPLAFPQEGMTLFITCQAQDGHEIDPRRITNRLCQFEAALGKSSTSKSSSATIRSKTRVRARKLTAFRMWTGFHCWPSSGK